MLIRLEDNFPKNPIYFRFRLILFTPSRPQRFSPILFWGKARHFP